MPAVITAEQQALYWSLLEAGRADEVVSLLEGQEDSHYAICLIRARAYEIMGSLQAAIELYQLAYRRCRDSREHAAVWPLLLNCMFQAGEFQTAWSWIRQQHSIPVDNRNMPRLVDFFNRLGFWMRDMNRLTEAEYCLLNAIKLDPRDVGLRWNLASVLLKQGKYQDGFKEYEYRAAIPQFAAVFQRIPLPFWDGGRFSGKKLLVFHEQGLGDAIQFLRLLPLVKMRGGHITVSVAQPLQRLCRWQWYIDDVVGFPVAEAQWGYYDYAVSLSSLPNILSLAVDNIPCITPYLSIDRIPPALELRSSLPDRSLQVGLCWAGNTTIMPQRSCDFAHVRRLLDISGVQFYSLQMDDREQVLAPLGSKIISKRAYITDLADTAAFLSQLDLIISIDTAVAHLSGALGKKTWVMLPLQSEWRWLTETRESQWYPSMSLFRQSDLGDWNGVIDAVYDKLCQWASSNRG